MDYYPPTIFFNGINFNNDFYANPNNNLGITLAYANTHYLLSYGVATSTASITFFQGSIGIGAAGTGINGDVQALTITANTINAVLNLQENGINLSNKYISSNVLASQQFINSNSIVYNYISSNQLYSQNYINSNSIINNYISSNQLFSQQFINSNSIFYNYISSNQLYSQKFINSNSITNNYISSNQLFSQQFINSNSVAYNYISSNQLASQNLLQYNIDGNIYLNNKMVSTNTGLNIPSVGSNGGSGDKIVLWAGNSSSYPYSFGIYPNNLWYSVPLSSIHNFYVGGSSQVVIGVGLTVNVNASFGQALTVVGSTYLNNNLTVSGSVGMASSLHLTNTAMTGNALRIEGGSSSGVCTALSIGGYGALVMDAYQIPAGRLLIDDNGNMTLGKGYLNVNNYAVITNNNITGQFFVNNNVSNYTSFMNFANTANGSNNCFIGMDGSNNKNIEFQALIMGTTANNSIIFCTNDNEYMRITSSGNVGIGTTNTNNYKLYVNGNIYANNICFKSMFYVQFPSTTTSFNGSSFYAYDIDLTKYTTAIYTETGSGGTTQVRKFRISTFLFTGYFLDSFAICDIEYSIYLSYLSGYTPTYYNGTYLIANGTPVNRNLQNIVSQNVFLIKNTFNIITLMSTNASLLLACIIEDQL